MKMLVLEPAVHLREMPVIEPRELPLQVIDDGLSGVQPVRSVAHLLGDVLGQHVLQHHPLALIRHQAAVPVSQLLPVSQICAELFF